MLIKKILLFVLPALILAGCESNTETKNSIASNLVKYVLIDGNGIKWFATDKGVSSFDGFKWKNYTSATGLPSGIINCLESANNNVYSTLWMGADKGLVEAYAQSDAMSVVSIYSKNTVPSITNDTIVSLHRDNSNILWIGTKYGLTGRIDSSTWIRPTTSNAISHFTISGIASSSDGWNYFATLGGGIARNKSTVDAITGASTYENPWEGLPSDSIYSVCVVPSTGDQWYGTMYGAAFHKGTKTKVNWSFYKTTNGLISDHIFCIIQDQQENIWFGTDSGVSRYDNISFTNFTKSDGLADNKVNCIAVDQDGSIWFATNNGVSHFNGSWINYSSK